MVRTAAQLAQDDVALRRGALAAAVQKLDQLIVYVR
jgi:hypothetical protein